MRVFGRELYPSELTFTNENTKSFTFVQSYSSVPAVVVTAVDSADNGTANVNVYVTSVSTTGFTANTSQTFTGEVHFHVMLVE